MEARRELLTQPLWSRNDPGLDSRQFLLFFTRESGVDK